MRSVMLKALVAPTMLSISLSGCLLDDDKGEEDEVFDVYETKSDSFQNPTLEGELAFGFSHQATLAEDARFHAWDFSLTDDAKVELTTHRVGNKIDTVMYIYKFSEETGRFGRFKFKNDDIDAGNVFSRLSKDLDAGQYRVLVKGFKKTTKGTFGLAGSCDGPGCADTSCDGLAVKATNDPASDACGPLLSAALSGTIQDTGAAAVTMDERCVLPDPARRAVEHYFNFWEDVVGFDDAFGGSADEPVELDVSWSVLSNNHFYVNVDGGGDEAAMEFVVDEAGDLIVSFLHNQSPEFTLMCDDGNTFADEECGFIYMDSMPHLASAERTGQEVVTGATAQATLDRAAFLAYDEYVRELELDIDTEVTVQFKTWENEFAGSGWDEAGRVTVEANGEPSHTYELAAASTTQWLFTAVRGDVEATLDCREM